MSNAAFLNLRCLLCTSSSFTLMGLPFPTFLVNAAMEFLALANSVVRLAIVSVNEVMVLQSADAAETKFESAC